MKSFSVSSFPLPSLAAMPNWVQTIILKRNDKQCWRMVPKTVAGLIL